MTNTINTKKINYNNIFPLGKYIRRAQYNELIWLATCISLADVKQLDLISSVRFLGSPGIYEFWEKRKVELK